LHELALIKTADLLCYLHGVAFSGELESPFSPWIWLCAKLILTGRATWQRQGWEENIDEDCE
jgi:hypothetical protein